MQVVKLSQREDRDAWLQDYKRGKIGGTRAKPIKPLTRGADRTPAALWDLVAEHLTKPTDYQGEKPTDRGNRLEREAVAKASKKLGIPFNDNAGFWISDFDEDISVSPDAAEPIDYPTYSMETKALGGGKHFKYLHKVKTANEDVKGIDLVPNETTAAFKEQCIQYFEVNEKLQDHYFVLYNEDCIFEEHELVIIHIKRSDIEDLIEDQKETQIQMMAIARDIIQQLSDGL